MSFDPSDPPEFIARVAAKREARMQKIDALPADIRELVHEYGYHVVNSFMLHGVPKAKHIRHLVETVLDEFSPTRGAYSVQGRRVRHDDEKPRAAP